MKDRFAQGLPGLMNDLRFERAIATALRLISFAVALPEVLGLGFTFRLAGRRNDRLLGRESPDCRCLIRNAGCGRLSKVPDSACTAPTVRKRHPVG